MKKESNNPLNKLLEEAKGKITEEMYNDFKRDKIIAEFDKNGNNIFINRNDGEIVYTLNKDKS